MSAPPSTAMPRQFRNTVVWLVPVLGTLHNCCAPVTSVMHIHVLYVPSPTAPYMRGLLAAQEYFPVSQLRGASM